MTIDGREMIDAPLRSLQTVQAQLETLDRMIYDNNESSDTHRTMVLGIMARLDAAIEDIKDLA
ncbi:MAG: hypothetical protein V3T23_01640 [Nitrososphaerales archaeon]